MTLESAYAAVVAAPREDAPRARFADLAASPEPATAAFVRDQLATAVRRRSAGRRDREIERAARRVLAPPPVHEARFRRARALLAGTVPAWAEAWGYGRGFLERACVDAAWFAARGVELAAAAPIVDVVLTGLPHDATECFDSPAWAHARSLRFAGPPPTAAHVEALAASPYFGALRSLDLGGAGLPATAIYAVAASPTLRGLRYVRADGNAFPDVNPAQDEQDGQVYGARPSTFAAELRARYGPLSWLSGVPAEEEPPPETWG